MPATALAKPVSPILRSGDPLARGLVLGLPLHEGGGTTVRDLSGRGSNGTLNNGVSWADGPFGRCLNFAGTPGGYVAVDTIPDLATRFTWCAWIYLNTAGINIYAVGGSSWRIQRNAGNLTFTVPGVDDYQFTNLPIGAGTWHFVAVSLTGTTATGYVDGASQAITVPVPTGVMTTFRLGDSAFGAFSPDGLMDAPCLYSRTLSLGEFAALYADSWRMYRPRRAWILRGGGGGSGITGSASGTLTSITGAASGSLTVTGSASGVITPVTGIVSGTVTIAGVAGGVLTSLTGSATGALAITGSASGSLSRITGSASSGNQITGTASASLSRVTGAASGTVSQSGAASGSLQAITGSASGKLSLTGSAAGTLPNVQGAASGAVTLTGAGSGALQPITGSAAGDLYLPGAAVGTLLSITGSASGSLTIQGAAAGLLRPITGRASDAPLVTGTASGTLSAITGSATGSIVLIGSHPVLTWKAQDPGRCWRTLDPGRCWKPPGRI